MRVDCNRKLAFQALSLFLLMVLYAARPNNAFAQAGSAGIVTSVSGTVHIARGTATIPVVQGTAVQVGDRITTADDGHVVVLLTDQSTLELSDSSNMVIDQHVGNATTANLLGGVLRSFVNRTAGAGAPNFEVHTPNAVAAARGTLFETAFRSGISRPGFGGAHDFTDLSVYDGVVHLANVVNALGGIDISAGYASTVADGLNPTNPEPLGQTGASSLGSTAFGAKVSTPLIATLTGGAVVGATVGTLCATGNCNSSATPVSGSK